MHVCVYKNGQMYNMYMYVEVRGQLVGVSSPLYHVGPGDKTHVMRFDGRCLFLLSFRVHFHLFNMRIW